MMLLPAIDIIGDPTITAMVIITAAITSALATIIPVITQTPAGCLEAWYWDQFYLVPNIAMTTVHSRLCEPGKSSM